VGKRTRKEKELAKVRRQLEVLKAQTTTARKQTQTSQELKKEVPSKSETQRVDSKYIKKDLLKAGILTIILMGIILVAWALRARIPFF